MNSASPTTPSSPALRAAVPAGPRFNPWPYSLIGFFVIALAGTATLVCIAMTHGTELVAPDYYDQEMRYQGRLDQLKRTLALEGRIEVQYVDRGVRIHLPKEHAALGATGMIAFYRPSSAGADRSVRLTLDAEGRQLLPLPDLPSGHWKVRIHWKAGDHDYFADRNLLIPAPGAAPPARR